MYIIRDRLVRAGLAGCILKIEFFNKSILLCALVVFTVAHQAYASTWYVDSTVGTSGDGTSWATAWKNLGNISSSVVAGDTVYLSGGPSGSSQTYKGQVTGNNGVLGVWIPRGGSAGNPVVYKVGQDSAHNGTVIFDATGADQWLYASSSSAWITIDGNVGGQRHMQVNATTGINCATMTGLTVRYITFQDSMLSLMNCHGSNQIEFDHNYHHGTNANMDHAIQGGFTANTWDVNKIHDNTFYLPRSSSNAGSGSDGIQVSCCGFSIYNNLIIGYPVAYTGGQHQDGWQGLGGSYIKVYNNTLENIGNYPIYGELFSANYTHLWIYNNLTIATESGVKNASQAIAVGNDAGGAVFTDVVIDNNVNDGYANGITLRNPTSGSATFTNCVVRNNISINGSNIIDPQVSTSNNLILNDSTAASDFVQYTNGSITNDYHLRSTATNLINQGVNQSQYFTTDKDGNPWPASGSWEVGAYVYGTVATTPPAPPTGLTAAVQ
jgi:hypothetical protein